MEPRASELARINAIVPLENLRTRRQTHVFVRHMTPFNPSYALYAKARIQGHETDALGRKKGSDLDLFFKKIPNLEKYKAGLALADEAHLPTCPDIYMVGPNTVGMTNLTADGSELFGKAYNDALHRRSGPLSKAEQQFLKISPEAIQEEVKRIVDQATKHNIHLSIDDPFECIIGPNGKFRLIILEVDGLRHEPGHHFLEDDNRQLGNQCLAILQNIRASLGKKKS